jgi:lysyl-tRNA synthetase class 2
LADEDTKIQNRHIDMLVNPETTQVLLLRSHLIRYMRDFFDERHFLEFQTPILAGNAGGAVARPFITHATEFPEKELAFRIAPELWLKRLVVGGVDRVFEIGSAFRNEGIDLTHNPEFTTCEFYCAYATLPELIDQTEDLLCGLAEHCHGLISSKLTSLAAVDVAKYSRPFKQVEFIPSLEKALGFRLPDLESSSGLAELLALLDKHNVPYASEQGASLPHLLDKLAAAYLEPFSAEVPIFITHHPACMSPLSKSFVCPVTGQLVSARAELFVGGRELANMYEEENDPFAQRRKFLDQSHHRDPSEDETAEKVNPAIDESYIQALESGLPPTGGWGCGIERLVMLFSGARRISDCLSFGTLRNVVALSTAKRR